MQKTTKKLQLNRVTIFDLTAPQVARVAGRLYTAPRLPRPERNISLSLAEPCGTATENSHCSCVGSRI